MDEDVLAANEAFYRAFNDRDLTAMDALWTEQAPAHCVHPGWHALTGREAIMDSWRAILANDAQPRLFAGGYHVTVNGDVAVVVCSELIEGGLLVATNIFVREDDAWRMSHHHSSGVAAS